MLFACFNKYVIEDCYPLTAREVATVIWEGRFYLLLEGIPVDPTGFPSGPQRGGGNGLNVLLMDLYDDGGVVRSH